MKTPTHTPISALSDSSRSRGTRLIGVMMTIFLMASAGAQTFIKITEGPVVTDQANFLGGAWADYDDDGFIDLLVAAGAEVFGQAPAFYHNLDGTNFVKLTMNDVGEVVGTRPYCGWAQWGDFNNDGNLDLLEIGWNGDWSSGNRFFLGQPDHTFTWVTEDIGVNPLREGPWQCALVDYDNDGRLDIYQTTGWVEGFAGNSRDVLCRNLGNGTFEPVWSPTGAITDTQFGCWADYDNDGDRDLWLCNYDFAAGQSATSQFYRNNGNGTFSDDLTDIEIPAAPFFYGAWGDYDNDGFQDFLCGTTLFHNDRNGRFTAVLANPAGGPGLWADYDNDGDLDFVTHLWSGVRQPSRFYRNDGGGVFTQVDLGPPSHDVPANETVPTWGDYNNDGFLDLFVATRGNPRGVNFLYRNSGLAGGNTNHWLIVKPRGTTSNRSAIGAKVRVRATIRGTDTWQLREIQGGTFDDLRAHFGLGDATGAATVRIEWPSGTVQELTNVAVDQILPVTEPRRPILSVVRLTPAGLEGTLVGDPNTGYQIRSSDDLGAGVAGWTARAIVTTDANGSAPWSDPGLAPQGRRFYQAEKAP